MNDSYHFIGIGGVGMSALAHILLQQGKKVSGSDLKESPVTKELEAKGAHIFYEQKHGNIQAGQTVVFSTAINPENPEYQDGKKGKLLHRSALLEQLMSEKKAIVVAGSHGKTTTTAILTHVLLQSGLDPAFVIGGFSPSLQTNGHWGSGDFFVAEGDESDGYFLRSKPFGDLVTKIDFDHLYYRKRKQA